MPTASHEETAQEMLNNCANGDPGGAGVACKLQPVPFHRSAKAPASPPPEASQALRAVQETPMSSLDCVAEGFGVGWIAQVLPFHRSAKVTSIPEPLT